MRHHFTESQIGCDEGATMARANAANGDTRALGGRNLAAAIGYLISARIFPGFAATRPWLVYAAPLLADLAKQTSVRYLHRPANLEDLFIKLTGRELRD